MIHQWIPSYKDFKGFGYKKLNGHGYEYFVCEYGLLYMRCFNGLVYMNISTDLRIRIFQRTTSYEYEYLNGLGYEYLNGFGCG